MPSETKESGLDNRPSETVWTRKKFIEATGLAALAVAVTGAANAQSVATGSQRQRRYGMVIDLQR